MIAARNTSPAAGSNPSTPQLHFPTEYYCNDLTDLELAIKELEGTPQLDLDWDYFMAGRGQQHYGQGHSQGQGMYSYDRNYGEERRESAGQEPFLTSAASAGSPPSPSSSPGSPTPSAAFPPTPTASTYPSLPLPLAPPTSIYSTMSTPHPNPLGPQFPSFSDTYQVEPKPLSQPQVYGRGQGSMTMNFASNPGLGLGRNGLGMGATSSMYGTGVAANGLVQLPGELQAAIRAQQQVRAQMAAVNGGQQRPLQPPLPIDRRQQPPAEISSCAPSETDRQQRSINPVKPGKESRADATLSAQRRPVQHQCHVSQHGDSREGYAPESSRKPRHGGPKIGGDAGLVPVPCDSSDDPDAEEDDERRGEDEPGNSPQHTRTPALPPTTTTSAAADARLTISPREMLKAAPGEPGGPGTPSPRQISIHPNLFKGLTPKVPSATVGAGASQPLFPPQAPLDNELSTNAHRFETERQRERAWSRKTKADAKRKRRTLRLGRSCSPALEGAMAPLDVAPMASLGQAGAWLNNQQARSTRMSKGHSRTRSQPQHRLRFAIPSDGDAIGAQAAGSWRDWDSDHGYYDSDASSSSSSSDFAPFRRSPAAVGLGPISFDVPRNAVMWRGRERRAPSVESGGPASIAGSGSARGASVGQPPSEMDDTGVEFDQAAEDLSPLSNGSEDEAPFGVSTQMDVDRPANAVGPPLQRLSTSADTNLKGVNGYVQGQDGEWTERVPAAGGRIWRGSNAGVEMNSSSSSNGYANGHSDSNGDKPTHTANSHANGRVELQHSTRPAHGGKRIVQQTHAPIETDHSSHDEETVSTATTSRRGGRGGGRGGATRGGRGGKTPRTQISHARVEQASDEEEQEQTATDDDDDDDNLEDATMDDETEEEWTPVARGARVARPSRGGRGRGRGRASATATPRRAAAAARGSAKRDREVEADADGDHERQQQGSSNKKARHHEPTVDPAHAATPTSADHEYAGSATTVESSQTRSQTTSTASQSTSLLPTESRPTGHRHGAHGEGPEIIMVNHNGREVPSAFPPWPSVWHDGVFECRWELDNPGGQPCGATFVRSYDLGRHGDGHVNKKLDPKPHKCPDCDNGFSRRDALQRHCRTKKHGDHAPQRSRKA